MRATSNKQKQILGEEATVQAFESLGATVFPNVPTDKFGGDIDALAAANKALYFTEVKNTNNDFKVYTSWLLTHVVNRIVKGAMIAQQKARELKLKIQPVLIIPKFTPACPLVSSIIKGLNIKIIETGKQALTLGDQQIWVNLILRSLRNQPERSVKTICNNYSSSSFHFTYFGSSLVFSPCFFLSKLHDSLIFAFAEGFLRLFPNDFRNAARPEEKTNQSQGGDKQ